MTDSQIIAALQSRPTLPSVYRVISEFRCGYWKALRCLLAAAQGRTWSMEDFL